jgi:uncharacterized protein (UPF0548 family)
VIALRRLGPNQVEAQLAKARRSAPNYVEVGASRDRELPPGYHHVRVRERIGDETTFDRAVIGLRTWAAHEGAGLRIYPHDPVVPDATVVAVTFLGFVQLVAPCRIVAVFKEPDLFGFSYGTLPGHPEIGEESFVLERFDDATYFTVSAFSRPVDILARLSGPIGRKVQLSVTRRYVQALRRFVETGATSDETHSD